MTDSLSVHAIESFLKKNQIANQTGSKEIRLTTKEMNEISASIASIMTKLVAMSIENDELKLQVKQFSALLNSAETNLDGGGFK